VLNRLSLREQRDLIANGGASPIELVDAHLAEIDKANSVVNAFVRVFAEEARAEAQSPKSGPLSGVPISIKDSFDVAGVPTYCGSKLRLDHRAASNAACVARLRAAGAIVIGKTNTPEFLANYETDNWIAGRTNNPLDPALTPGGSSGGESAAISAYFSAGGVGSDGGGSVRWPVHCCGIAGLKPTPGVVSAAGHYPAISNPAGMMGVAGPMARTVADVKLLFEVLRGYDPLDPYAAPVAPEQPKLEGVRIGVWPQFYKTPVQAECADAVARAARALSHSGFAVEEFEPRGLERAPNLWAFLFTELSAPFTRELIEGRRDLTHWTGTEFLDAIEGRPEPTGRKVVEVLSARDAMRANLLRQMWDVPVILTAAAGMTAFRHRQRRFQTPSKEIGLFEGTFPLVWANLLGLPALIVPAGGLGVQLVGAPYSEDLLLALGERLEAELQ
jgi:Asp-tRNA(Asn)/Glu-tRNA(Gln) amidotransferase A subunit family amidase